MKTVVVTGAAKGLGLEFCRQYAEKGYHLIGLCRKASEALKATKTKIIDNCDLLKEDSFAQIKQKLSGIKIDLLINNAGMMSSDGFGELSTHSLLDQFKLNALAPLLLTQTLFDQLNDQAQIAMITSRMGSISDNTSGGYYGYRMSKAALNMASVSLAKDLKDRNIIISILHPGYVRTDMTHNQGNISPKESVSALIKRIEEYSLDQSGIFKHCNGSLIGW